MDTAPFALKDNAVSIIRGSELERAIRPTVAPTESFGTRLFRSLMDWFGND